MPVKTEDRFSNIISARVTMAAINTMTWQDIATGVSLGTGVGMLIDHIDYFPSPGTMADIDTDSDLIVMGVAVRTTGNLEFNDNTVIDAKQIVRQDFGAAASGVLIEMPFERYFSPPIIVAAPRLYLGVLSLGMSVVAQINCRIYFRYINLTDKEYLEIAETFIMVG